MIRKKKKKKSLKVIDPPKYPKVINGYEGGFKAQFAIQSNMMLADVTKKLVQFMKT